MQFDKFNDRRMELLNKQTKIGLTPKESHELKLMEKCVRLYFQDSKHDSIRELLDLIRKRTTD